jgi:predicted nucleic acid-binding protein
LEYFDSDVIFNFLVLQNEHKHIEARNLVFDAIQNSGLIISTLTIQEVGYALSRFGLSDNEIWHKLHFLSEFAVVGIQPENLVRALHLARQIGFKHINDCLHTAIGETLTLEKFYTYNASDFKRIQNHTRLNIIIL